MRTAQRSNLVEKIRESRRREEDGVGKGEAQEAGGRERGGGGGARGAMVGSNAHNARNREATASAAWKIHWVIPK